MDWNKFKNILSNIWSFLTLGNTLSFKGILLIYFLIIGLFYSFSILIYKDFFTFYAQLKFFKTIGVIILLHLYLSLIYLINSKNKKENFFNIFKSIKKCVFNKIEPFKLQHITLISYLLFYIIFSYLIFRQIVDLNSFYYSPTIVFLIFIKVWFSYKLINMLSLTNNAKHRNLSVLLPLSLVELTIITINELVRNKISFFANFSSLKDTMFSLITGNFAVYTIVILLALILFIVKRPKFIIEPLELDYKSTITSIFFFSFIYGIMFAIISATNPQDVVFRFTQVKTAYIFKEMLMIFLLFVSLFSLCAKLIKLKVYIDNPKDSNNIKRYIGTVVGNASYSYKDMIFSNISIEKTIQFTILNLNNKEKKCISKVKTDSLIYPLNLKLCKGDKIEVIGYEIENLNLNDKKELKELSSIVPFSHIVPLCVNIQKESQLRNIIE